MEDISDNKLLQEYMNGDMSSFDELVHRYTKILYRFLLPILQDKILVEDCIQETFIKVWKNAVQFNPEMKFKNWIFIIAKRTALDIIKKRKNIPFSFLDDEDDQSFEQNIPDNELLPNEIFEQSENTKIIEDALKKISPENRSIIILHHVEEMTFEEISTILEEPMNTIKSKYRRSLLRLRFIIEGRNAPKL